MRVEFRITEDDYANAVQFHQWRSALRWRSTMISATGLIVLILLILAVWWEEAATLLIFLVVWLALLVVFLVTYMYTGVPYIARRTYRRYKAIQEPMTIELADEVLRLSSLVGEANLPWRMIVQWRQNNRFVLVYTMPRLFYLVPKSLAQQGFDIQALVQRLAERVGPEH
jgi:hypothetical protein